MSAARIAGLGSGLLVLCAARAWAADARCPASFAKASGACDERVSVRRARVRVSGGQVLVRAEHAVQWCADAAGRAALALSGGADGRLPERRASAGRRLRVTGQDLLVRQLRVARVHVRRAESGVVHFGRHRAAAQHGRRWRRPRRCRTRRGRPHFRRSRPSTPPRPRRARRGKPVLPARPSVARRAARARRRRAAKRCHRCAAASRAARRRVACSSLSKRKAGGQMARARVGSAAPPRAFPAPPRRTGCDGFRRSSRARND